MKTKLGPAADILLVDDDPKVLDILGESLGRHGTP